MTPAYLCLHTLAPTAVESGGLMGICIALIKTLSQGLHYPQLLAMMAPGSGGSMAKDIAPTALLSLGKMGLPMAISVPKSGGSKVSSMTHQNSQADLASKSLNKMLYAHWIQ